MRKYTKSQIEALLHAAVAQYERAEDCATARLWLNAQHALRDRLQLVSR